MKYAVSFETMYSWSKNMGFPYQRYLFEKSNGYKPDFTQPKSLNEKTVYRTLFGNIEYLTIISDKLLCKEFLVNEIGIEKKYIISTLAVIRNVEDVNILKELGKPFILKCNHGSGRNIIIDNNTHLQAIKNYTVDSLNNKLYHYKKCIRYIEHIKPAVFAEPLISDNAIDYKFHVFTGSIRTIQVMQVQQGVKRHRFYNLNWQAEPFYKEKMALGNFDKPRNLEKMIELCYLIGKRFSYLRIDLYNINGRILIGELTPSPGSGYKPIYPRKFDYQLGKEWRHYEDLKHLYA